MNNVVVLLVALLVGIGLGAATFAVVTRDEPELRQPDALSHAEEDGPAAEIAELRAQLDLLRAELEQAATRPDSPPEAVQPGLGTTTREALRRMLRREPSEDEVKTVESWISRDQPAE